MLVNVTNYTLDGHTATLQLVPQDAPERALVLDWNGKEWHFHNEVYDVHTLLAEVEDAEQRAEAAEAKVQTLLDELNDCQQDAEIIGRAGAKSHDAISQLLDAAREAKGFIGLGTDEPLIRSAYNDLSEAIAAVQQLMEEQQA